jgi:pyochelin synthetase
MVAEGRQDAAALIENLESMGVQLWVEDAQIRYRAPLGLMTGERLASLRERRAEIAAVLAAEAGDAAVRHDAGNRFSPFPLTDVQAAYVTGRAPGYPYGGVGCHGYGELQYEDADPARLEDAWNTLIGRHDMLRAVVSSDGTQQVRSDQPRYHLEVNDLGDAPPGQFCAAVEATRADMDHRVYAPGEWPLFDLRLTVAGRQAVLHFSVDFLIADFVSIQVLLGELEREYGEPGTIRDDLEITFRDFQLARRAARDGSTAVRDRAYWHERVDSLPEPPELPIFPADGKPARFRRLPIRLAASRWDALRRLAHDAGITPSCAILAAYAEVVGRWSRRPDFTLNITVLSRPDLHPQIRQLVGDFTSVELLAVRSAEPGSFRRRAQALQERLWEDIDHGLYSVIDVMRELRKRRASGLTLFPVVFTSSLGLRGDPGPSALTRMVHGISQTPQVWLDCQVMEAGGRLEINWDVREGVFQAGVAEAMSRAFEDLLGQLAGGGEAWNSACPVAVPAEQLARRPRPAPGPRLGPGTLLQDRVLIQAEAHPDRAAVIAGSRTLTYGELAGRAAAVAEALADRGCAPGSVVSVEMDKGWEQVVAVLGILTSGCAYVPVDTTQPLARRDRIIADAGTPVVLTASATDRDRPPGTSEIALDTLGESGRSGPRNQHGGQLAYVIYTSGSTGTPKGVMISHHAALNTIEEINGRFGIGAGDRVLGLANLGFDLSVYDIFGLLAAGGSLVLPDARRRADPAHWAELIDTHQVTIWNSVPAQLEMLMAYLRSDAQPDLAALRLALLSGDWIPPTLPDRIWSRMPGLRLISLGGATEASIWSIIHPIHEVDPELPSIPYGRALAGQTVEVLDPGLRPVPDLVAGEICIGGAGLADGYFADRAKSAERFVVSPATGQRLYRTGDLGRYLPDGAIEFLGREDSQVKIRGHRVELAEVEAALGAYPSIAAATVVTTGERPDPIGLAAFAEAAPAAPGDEPAGVRPDELRSAALAGAASLRSQVRDEEMLAFARELDATALLQMLSALRSCGLFATAQDSHTVPEIITTAQVAPRHHRLVRRWLRALRDNGLIRQDGHDDRYTAALGVDAAAVREGWRRVAHLVPEIENRTELISYFETTSGMLPELLRGDVDPLTLLFPEGRTEIHEVAYNGIFLSRYLNRLLTSAACRLAGQRDGSEPFRVLEVGSGVGGTSAELIPALAPFGVEYLFTDVSEFFLTNARRRYAEFPWVDYARYDMNADFRAQGLLPNSYDLIVCANVLHYAHSVAAVIPELRQLVQPGGWILFIEATRDSYQIMTSMEFLFDEASGEFDDVRRRHEQTFVTRSQWLEVLAAAGADAVLCLPEQDPITDQMGMHLFAARFKSARARVRRTELERHLAATLPGHMLPSRLQVVDHLPITANGKIDRTTLRSWLARPAASPGAPGEREMPSGETELQLAAVWERLLRVHQPGRQQSFFELGGDSLVAAQLATEIRQAVPGAAAVFYDDILQLILENATIASLAERIGDGHRAAAPPAAVAQSAAMTQPGARAGRPALAELSGGPGPVTVLIHDGTGTLAAYQPLLDLLGTRMRLAGLTVPDPDAYLTASADSLVEEVAAGYTAVLRIAGEGPLQLTGHGFGGILAAEVARQLTEAGARMGRLVVVAAQPPAWPPADDLTAELLFWRELGIGPGQLTPGGRAPVGPDGPLELAGLRPESRENRFARLGALVPAVHLEEAYELFLHSMEAVAAHQLLPYAGDIVLVRPQAVPGWLGGTEEMTQYWRDACLGDLTVVDLADGGAGCLAHAPAEVSALLAEWPPGAA